HARASRCRAESQRRALWIDMDPWHEAANRGRFTAWFDLDRYRPKFRPLSRQLPRGKQGVARRAAATAAEPPKNLRKKTKIAEIDARGDRAARRSIQRALRKASHSPRPDNGFSPCRAMEFHCVSLRAESTAIRFRQ